MFQLTCLLPCYCKRGSPLCGLYCPIDKGFCFNSCGKEVYLAALLSFEGLTLSNRHSGSLIAFKLKIVKMRSFYV